MILDNIYKLYINSSSSKIVAIARCKEISKYNYSFENIHIIKSNEDNITDDTWNGHRTGQRYIINDLNIHSEEVAPEKYPEYFL